jgi:hypothetical protein
MDPLRYTATRLRMQRAAERQASWGSIPRWQLALQETRSVRWFVHCDRSDRGSDPHEEVTGVAFVDDLQIECLVLRSGNGSRVVCPSPLRSMLSSRTKPCFGRREGGFL